MQHFLKSKLPVLTLRWRQEKINHKTKISHAIGGEGLDDG